MELPVLLIVAVACALAALALFGSFLTSRTSALVQRLQPDQPRASTQWSAEDWGKIGAAVVALLGAVGTFYTTVKPPKTANLAAVIASRDSARTELAAMRQSVRTLVRFDPQTWQNLPHLAEDTISRDVRVDDRSVTGLCAKKAGTTIYDGTGPARIVCGSQGELRLRLARATVVLLVPPNAP